MSVKCALVVLWLIVFFVQSSSSARAEAALSVCIREVSSGIGVCDLMGNSAPVCIERLTGQELSSDGFFIRGDQEHLQKYSPRGSRIPGNGDLLLRADATGKDEQFLAGVEGDVLQHILPSSPEKDADDSVQKEGAGQVMVPAPGADNAEGIPSVPEVYVAAPRFSHEAGFYDTPFDLTMEGEQTCRLFYTTDGSVPDENSTLYSGPVHISDATNRPNTLSMRTDITVKGAVPPTEHVKKATIIRAVAVDPEGNRSKEVTNAYFVGFQDDEAYQDIPILSVVADPYDLFDEQDGIYVLGKEYQKWLSDENHDPELTIYRIPANYRLKGSAWEIPVSIQWFDAQNTLRLSQGAGLRIYGDWSRESANKSMSLYARKEYGADTFQVEILPGTAARKQLAVRNNPAWDSLLHALLQETGLQVSLSIPCLAFINGEFWGLYEIRDMQDAEAIADRFGLKEEDLIVVRNQELIAGSAPDEVVEKGIHEQLISEISAQDAGTPQGYEAISELMDVENYTTWIAANAYLNNTGTDHGNNCTIWRTAEKGNDGYEDGRWRWVFQDLDMSCYSYEGAEQMILSLSEDVIFQTLWKSEAFRTRFLTRIMDLANVELTTEYVKEYITPVLTYCNPYLRETNTRFASEGDAADKPGTRRISAFMSFFTSRREEVIRQLTEVFSLDRSTSRIRLTPLNHEISLQINGHQAHLYDDAWTGEYFTGCSVRLSVGDIPGYQFDGWYEGDERISSEETLEISTDTDRTLVPVYREIPVISLLNAKEILYGSGKSGFTIPLKDPMKMCVLLPDTSMEVTRNYLDNTITFRPDSAVGTPQGFTLTVPLTEYISEGGGFFELSAPDGGGQMKWRVFSRTGETSDYQELAVKDTLRDGLTKLSFAFPDEQMGQRSIDIRLEAEKENGTFILRGFRVYGMPMEASRAMAYEYARVAEAVGADEKYVPDLDQLADLDAEETEAEITSLRRKLQSAMTAGAMSDVASLGENPAWEGLSAYPVVFIDEKLIQAFYNQDAIGFPCPMEGTVYLYQVVGKTLQFRNTVPVEGSVISLEKQEGTFLLLDRPVETIRFRVSFDRDPIPDTLMTGSLSGMVPQSYLWMNMETLTGFQEESPIGLPISWSVGNVWLYQVRDDELVFRAETTLQDNTIRFTPAEGRYLLLDESVESYAEQAGWKKQEILDGQRTREREDQKRASTRKTLILIGCVLIGVIIAGTAAVVIRRRRGK